MTLGRVPVAEDNVRPLREVRWSARRKMEAVLRLLRGESLDVVSREWRAVARKGGLQIPPYRPPK